VEGRGGDKEGKGRKDKEKERELGKGVFYLCSPENP